MNVELLAPAGSFESLKAAIRAGADAVYLGGTKFGARAYAKNLEEDHMLEAIDYTHMYGKKIYLTVNTLLKEQELEQELFDYLQPYYENGLDAVIVQDMGVFSFIKRNFPGLSIHASTQMTITGEKSAGILYEEGAQRIVTARELSLEEIAKIHSRYPDLEIESFVHGALCYCYSGQCLFSSLIGGRSGNRGRCAQPCRLPYTVYEKDRKLTTPKTNYPLSPKDMCTIEILPEILKAGVYSLKIEGRMKKPEYTAGVVEIYRKYIDRYKKNPKNYKVEKRDLDQLYDIYNRDGFNQGYYKQYHGVSMMALENKKENKQKQNNQKQNSLSQNTRKQIILRQNSQKQSNQNQNSQKQSNQNQNSQKQSDQNQNSLNQMKYNTRNEELFQRIHDQYLCEEETLPVKGSIWLAAGQPMKLEINYKDIQVIQTGELVSEALNKPVSEQQISKKICQTGNTCFFFDRLDVYMEGDIFVPISALNELRRTALEILKEQILAPFRRKLQNQEKKSDTSIELQNPEENINISELSKKKIKNDDFLFAAAVEEKEQLAVALKEKRLSRIYCDCKLFQHQRRSPIDWLMLIQVVKKARENEIEIFMTLPQMIRHQDFQIWNQDLKKILDTGVSGFLVRNLETFGYIREQNLQDHVILDQNLYNFNQEARRYWQKQKVMGAVLPAELNFRELEKRNVFEDEMVIYGYSVMMTSVQCVKDNMDHCNQKNAQLYLVDRFHKKFPVKCNCQSCYNTIYNCIPTGLLKEKKELQNLGISRVRLSFTIENAQETQQILDLFLDSYMLDKIPYTTLEFTRGHFRRGIE